MDSAGFQNQVRLVLWLSVAQRQMAERQSAERLSAVCHPEEGVSKVPGHFINLAFHQKLDLSLFPTI
jgi:hypothetical protein